MSKENPDYRVLLPKWNGPEPYLEFSNAQKRTIQGQRNPWRVAPDDKKQPAHQIASTCESLLNIYPNAMEIGSPMGSEGKTILGVIHSSISFIGAAMILYMGTSSFTFHDLYGYTIFGISLTVSIIFTLCTIFFLKMAFFTPRDLPVLFNRKTLQVSFIPYIRPHFWKFWMTGGPDKPRTYSWKDVKVRSYKWTQFTGSAARESYLLTLLWGEPSNPKPCKEIVNIGYAGWWEDAMLWRLYEHIRRYMEEGGRPIQHGESLRRNGIGKLPTFPPEIIAAAGGPALSDEEVSRLASN